MGSGARTWPETVDIDIATGIVVAGLNSVIVVFRNTAGPARHRTTHWETEAPSSLSQPLQGMVCEDDMALSAIMDPMAAALVPCAIREIAISTPRQAHSHVRARNRMGCI